MTALAIDAPGAGGGGVALTQLSGRYVPPEVKKSRVCRAKIFAWKHESLGANCSQNLRLKS